MNDVIVKNCVILKKSIEACEAMVLDLNDMKVIHINL